MRPGMEWRYAGPCGRVCTSVPGGPCRCGRPWLRPTTAVAEAVPVVPVVPVAHPRGRVRSRLAGVIRRYLAGVALTVTVALVVAAELLAAGNAR